MSSTEVGKSWNLYNFSRKTCVFRLGYGTIFGKLLLDDKGWNVPTYKSRISAEVLENYRWNLRVTWREIEARSGLSKGWVSGLVSKKREGFHLKTVDAIANAIASILLEQGKPVPDDLWFQLVEIETREDSKESEGVPNQS